LSLREDRVQDRLHAAAVALRKLRIERDALAQEKTEPIAIVGMGCRLPGGADHPEAFWSLLRGGRDAILPLDSRWALAGHSPAPEVPRWAGLLTQPLEQFDAEFFGISPREAATLDPQHRLLLEVAWEALEDAGIAPRSLEGSKTGVFVGACSAEYRDACLRTRQGEQDAYTMTGNLVSIAAGRLSYTLGLQGPCLTVDTACSSSLVALHLALWSLRLRESSLALVGGVNVILSAAVMEGLARTQALSPDGRCRTFDAAANGFVRGEGCGVLVLKRLSDAQQDRDRILAVVRGSAVNQDGRSTGLTAPNVLAQQALLREALESARLKAEEVSYIEAHGTGTPLGDPIELEALRAVAGAPRSNGSRCVIGAVKTQIGHLEGAAGIAGVIKAVLALRHELIPGNLNLRTVNPRIRLENSALALATAPVPWPRGERPRIAGVSAFGLSGTNAHVLLEEVPPTAAAEESADQRPVHLLPLSARSPAALQALIALYDAQLAASPDQPLADVAFSAATGRSAMAERLVVIAATAAEAQAKLGQAAAGEPADGVLRGRSESGRRPRVAFLFTGQGSQYVGMGRELYQTQPVFRRALEECARILDDELQRPLVRILYPEQAGEALLDDTEYTQPALFAVEYALVQLWKSWGVEPEAVLGHSIGEYVAACIAEVMSLEDALQLVVERGRLMTKLEPGAMAAVRARAELVERAIKRHAAEVAIAAYNGPEHLVISGRRRAVESICAGLAREGIKTTALAVSHAFHSPLMEPMLAAFKRAAGLVPMKAPRLALVSNVTGGLVKEEVRRADYWWRHLREPVRFREGIKTLHELGVDRLIEIGPQPTLLGLGAACVDDPQVQWLPSLRKGRSDWQVLVESLGRLWVGGAAVDFAGFDRPYPRQRIAVPTYPWQRQRCWVEPLTAAQGGTQPEPTSADREAPQERAVTPAAAAERPAQPELLPAARVGRPPLYALSWQRQLLPQSAAPTPAGTWLILLDGQGLGERLAQALEARGATCIRLRRPAESAASADLIDDSAAAIRAVLPQPGGATPALRGVVDLWSAAEVGQAGSPPAGCHRMLCRFLGSARALLGDADPASARARLWVITRGAASTGPGDPLQSPAQAALWGLGRVLALEHPELWGGLIDLPPSPASSLPPPDREPLLPMVVGQLLAPDGEDQLAVRATGRYVLRLQRLAEAPAERPQFQTAGTALVTGGLGALGLHIAHFLVQRGARHLVLTGRRGLSSPGTAPEIERLRELGVGVTVADVDVTDAAAMRALFAEIDASLPPLRTVVHAAGVASSVALTAIDGAQLRAVLSPKVAGTLVLEELTRDLQLDALICFSSAAAVWGSPGLGAYAAANAFLDAFAGSHASSQRRILSVAWGPWEGGGMASPAFIEQLQASGLTAFTPDAALRALALALGEPTPHLVAAAVDWPRFRAVYESRGHRRLFSQLAEPAAAASASPELSLAERLAPLTSEARQAEVQRLVRAAVGAVLHLPPAAVPSDRPLQELGLDSLMAVEVRTKLSRHLGEPLPATLVFDYPTIEKLCGFLLGRVSAAPSPPPAILHQVLRPADSAIAILGMSCRLPGGVRTPEELWVLLAQGRDAITEVPRERWDVDKYYDPDPERAGKMYSRWGGFIGDLAEFDAGFFGIAPREAASLDPQQRLLLEVSWEALERAALSPDRLLGSRSGVFVGISGSDYGARLLHHRSLEQLDAYVGTGNLASVAAGRLAYWLGFGGPTLAVDTACSSSLVAVHLACQSLRDGECELALAAGVNLLLAPQGSVALSRMRALSPDGRCKPFAAAANGYVRSEGCGVLVLKRLADAQRDGDPVLAVIRGSAMNQGGRSNGLTAPSGLAQQAVIRRALAQAGVTPAQVGYVEAHGTGTALGDPIELQSLDAVLHPGRAAENPAIVGALKSNIGHAEAAAGVAGLIKAVLVLQHGVIPANLHFQAPNPHISWSELALKIPTEPIPWTGAGGARIAGVSSFGISGTNAHVILEAAPPPAAAPDPAVERPLHLLPLSARNDAALRALAELHADRLAASPAPSLGDTAFSIGTGRSAMEQRLALIAGTSQQAQQKLRQFAGGELPADCVRGSREPDRRAKIAFLFTGQGAQYVGMGRELQETQPVFRAALQECAQLLEPVLPLPLLSVLYPAEGEVSPLDDTAYTQPALFAVEYALFALWRSWGIEPAVVLGHSVGEYVAACVAGVMSLKDGLRLVAERGRLMQKLAPGGAMASVRADAAAVSAALSEYAGEVAIAAYNAPDQIVLSGPRAQLEALCRRLAEQGIKTRQLVGTQAFHSPLMEPILEDFERFAARVELKPAQLPLVSNLTGRLAAEELAHAEHWRRHAREPVRFAEGMRTLHELGVNTYVEIGPQPTLLALGAATLPGPDLGWLPSLRKERSGWAVMLESLARLWCSGVEVDWLGFERPFGRRRVAVPTYPWQRQRHWIDADVEPAGELPAEASGGRYRLSGRSTELPGGVLHFTLPIGQTRQPYLADHRVFGHVVVAGAFYPAVLLAIAADRFAATTATLREVLFVHPLILTGDLDLHLMLQPDPGKSNHYTFTAATFSKDAGSAAPRWREHAKGLLILGTEAPAEPQALADLRTQHPLVQSVDALFAYLSQIQIDYGPGWRWMRELYAGAGSALSQLGPSAAGDQAEGPLHPGLIDNAFATVAGALLAAAGQGDGTSRPPWMFKELRWFGAPRGRLWCRSRLQGEPQAGEETMAMDLVLFEDTGRVVAAVDGLVTKRARPAAFLRQEQKPSLRYEVAWRPVQSLEVRPASRPLGRWLLFGSRAPLAAALAAQLGAAGQAVVMVEAGERFEKLAADHYRLRPTAAEDYRAALQEIFATEAACCAVIHLWSLDSSPAERTHLDSLQRDLELGTCSGLLLVQALTQLGWRQPPHLCLVTAGTQATPGDTSISVSQAPLWGLGQSVQSEHPELDCRRIDLSAGPDADPGGAELSALLRELLAGAEPQVALRGERRYVPRLIRAPAPPTPEPAAPLRPRDSSYLITGGLSGLGLATAELLAKKGATHLVLAGRHPPGAEALQAIERMSRLGTLVVPAAVDVAQQAELAALLGKFGQKWPPLRGIVHSAAVILDGTLATQTLERLRQALAAKVFGAWNLHELTQDRALDFFVSYSSVATLLGGSGQSSYVAANQFVDALAHFRRGRGQPGMSINWGGFSAIGIAARRGISELYADRGLASLSPEEGMQQLWELLGGTAGQTVVLKLDAGKLGRSCERTALAGFVSELVDSGSPAARQQDQPPQSWRERILAAEAPARQALLEQLVTELMSQILRLPGAAIGPAVPLLQLGMDSLMVIELRNRIDRELALQVPASLLMSGVSVHGLAKFLLESLASAEPAVETEVWVL